MKNSFRDPATNALKAWGYVEANAPDDIAQSESDDFNLKPGEWQWTGSAWIPHTA